MVPGDTFINIIYPLAAPTQNLIKYNWFDEEPIFSPAIAARATFA